MGLYTIINRANLQNGQPENIADVVANLDAVAAVLNGGVDAANFGAGKILLPSKLSQEGATSNQYLAWNGTIWAPRSLPLILRTSVGTFAGSGYVANTLTTVLTFTIPANTLNAGVNKKVRVVLAGDLLNNSGASRALRIKVLLGASTLWDSTSGALVTSANSRPLLMPFDLVAGLGGGIGQYVQGKVSIGGATAPTTGHGNLANANVVDAAFSGGPVGENPATDLDLVVQFAFDGTHANLSVLTFPTVGEVV